MFNVKPEFRAKSLTDSETVTAAPACFQDDRGYPDGNAVVVYADGRPRLTITTDAALRLAHKIADVLAHQKETSR